MTVLDILARNHGAPWTAIPLAMGAGPAVGPWLADAACGDEPAEVLLALGVLGDPSGLDVLLEALHVAAHAAAAALGLFLMTGALLGAPEAEDADELDDPAPGSAWTALQGSGISTDPAAWATWMTAHRHRLRPGQRHRLGVLATPQTDLAVLSSSSFPLWLRRLLADELAIRYGVLWAYEPDLYVARQREIVARVQVRLADPYLRFIPGAWYFQGRPVESEACV